MTNAMEPIVRRVLNEMLEKTDCCKCPVCYSDMLAIALNSVQPKYTNTHEGELLVKVGQGAGQNSIDINVAVTKAIEQVKNNPRHPKR